MKPEIKECRSYAVRAKDADHDLRMLNEEDVLTMAKTIMEARFSRSHYLTSPDITRQYLSLALANEPREVFALVLLDNQNGVIGLEILFYGTIDGATVYPREVVKIALQANAASVILAHNHPSGHAEPSQADKMITDKIAKALMTVDIRTLDHLIVAGASTVSLAERGWMT